MQCPECGSYIPRGETSCPVCGELVAQGERREPRPHRERSGATAGKADASSKRSTDSSSARTKDSSSKRDADRSPARKAASSERPSQAGIDKAAHAATSNHAGSNHHMDASHHPSLSSKSTLLRRVIPTAGVLIIVLAVLLFATKGFGLFAEKSVTQSGEEISLSVRGTLDQYSWEEISAISHKMATAANDEEAFDIAVEYNLADEDGLLYDELKEVTLTDGSVVGARIIDYRHDVKPDGSHAGLTFMLSAPVAVGPMAPETNEGGWAASSARSWLSSDLPALLPSDLVDQLVPVVKKTNNTGFTADPASVTETQDTFWLFSTVEVSGPVDWYTADYEPYDALINAEGSAYSYFSDKGIGPVFDEEANADLIMEFGDEPCSWWFRTAKPSNPDLFCNVDDSGHTGAAAYPQNSYAYVVGFCL